MFSAKRWLLLLLLLVGLGGGGYFFLHNTQIFAQEGAGNTAVDAAAEGSALSAISIQPVSAAFDEVSASGHIALVNQLVVAPEVSGKVQAISVEVGDEVIAGDLLLTLDTVELERALKRAELTVEAQRNALAQLTEAASAAELAVAQANLAEAEQNLADVQAGPSDAEIAAARSSVASAWAKYNELQAGPSQAELTQLSADRKKAEIALAEAQRAYDKVAWRNDVGMTSEAAALQDATIDNEKAQAAYEVSVAAANNSEVQSAISSAQSAQAQLDDLLNSPTAAAIAQAEAQVADAQAALADLQQGPTATELRSTEISLEQALVDLEEAHANLAAAKIYAPAAGTVLAIDTGLGARVSAGSAIVTLADTAELELTIDVAELDVPQVAIGQPVQIEIDALTGKTLQGEVTAIAPSSDSTSGVIYYPVTIRLTDDELANVRPGMTAVATIRNTQVALSDGWLVPTTAIAQVDGQSVVTVVDGENTRQVRVATGAVQGEWTVVQSQELAAGDQVQGTLASFTNENTGRFGPPGGGPPGGGPRGQ
ncbi:MAG: efflux RND transporter periplasmic adaptor subunit [Caldilineaceae bacterium]|nr:efflux RND transporter periplasmic adaptor subunit [Caldilineaceae bacterium]